jgi:hypothetical protein
MKKFYTQEDLQTTLANGAPSSTQIFYAQRELTNVSLDSDVICYYMTPVNTPTISDNIIHIRKVQITLIHYHRTKLANIGELMAKTFCCQGNQFDDKDQDSQFYATYYEFEIYSNYDW